MKVQSTPYEWFKMSQMFSVYSLDINEQQREAVGEKPLPMSGFMRNYRAILWDTMSVMLYTDMQRVVFVYILLQVKNFKTYPHPHSC